jgi:hypothetical protein
MCSTATLLLVAMQGDDYGLLGQNVLLWISSCICSVFGWRGSRFKLKTSVAVYVVCSIWVFSAYVVQLYSSSKTDRVGELMCEEYNLKYHGNRTKVECAGTSVATPSQYGTPSAQILMSKTLLWGINSVVVVVGIYQGLLLAHCMDETGQGVNRQEKKIKRENALQEKARRKAARKALGGKRCWCFTRKGTKLHPDMLGYGEPPPPTPLDTGEHMNRTGLNLESESAAAQGVLASTLAELKKTLTYAAARTSLICVAQFFVASGTLSMNMYVDIEEQGGGRATSGMSMLRSIIAPLTAFLVPLIGIVGAQAQQRNMLIVFLVLQLMGLSTVTTFVFTTIRYSYCTHTVLILYSYCTHTVLILYSYCTHTALILHSYSYCTRIHHHQRLQSWFDDVHHHASRRARKRSV